MIFIAGLYYMVDDLKMRIFINESKTAFTHGNVLHALKIASKKIDESLVHSISDQFLRHFSVVKRQIDKHNVFFFWYFEYFFFSKFLKFLSLLDNLSSYLRATHRYDLNQFFYTFVVLLKLFMSFQGFSQLQCI